MEDPLHRIISGITLHRVVNIVQMIDYYVTKLHVSIDMQSAYMIKLLYNMQPDYEHSLTI